MKKKAFEHVDLKKLFIFEDFRGDRIQISVLSYGYS